MRPTPTPLCFDEGAHGIGPRMSLLVTFCSLGEGWHDYHHHFPWDYAAAELDARHQFNPTKVFIDSCYHLGLCSDRRRCLAGNQLARRSRLSRSAVSVIPKVHDGSDGGAIALTKHLDDDATEQLAAQYEIRGLPFLRYRVRRPPKDAD